MKKLLSLLMALMMFFALAACGQPADPAEDENPEDVVEVENPDETEESDLAYVTANEKLIIGYTLYEPMNYEGENGDLTGFDTELATLVCEKLGVEAEFIKINWDTKEIELNAKSIDCIWNGMTINDERMQTMEVTKPYVKNAQVVVMKSGADYTDTSSLIGKTVVAEKGSAGEETVQNDENLAQATYVSMGVQTDCLLEVVSGTADAAVLDLTLANTMTGEGTSYADLEIMDRLGEEKYGVAFRKGSDICAEVNAIFDELVADGTLGALAEKYGLDLAF